MEKKRTEKRQHVFSLLIISSFLATEIFVEFGDFFANRPRSSSLDIFRTFDHFMKLEKRLEDLSLVAFS